MTVRGVELFYLLVYNNMQYTNCEIINKMFIFFTEKLVVLQITKEYV